MAVLAGELILGEQCGTGVSRADPESALSGWLRQPSGGPFNGEIPNSGKGQAKTSGNPARWSLVSPSFRFPLSRRNRFMEPAMLSYKA